MLNIAEIPQNELALIEGYLLKELSTEEQLAFEQRLAADTQLQQWVKQTRLFSVGIQEAVLTEKMETFHSAASLHKQAPVVKMNRVKKIAIAAAVVIVVATGAIWLTSQKNTNEELYATYFKPDPGLPTVMGVEENYAFDKAMVDYKTGQYAEAINSWMKLKETNPNGDTLNYFIGAALLAKQETKNAISYFDKVIANTKSSFLNEAYWYKGLALLKEGKQQEAIICIQQSKHAQADALLKKLNK